MNLLSDSLAITDSDEFTAYDKLVLTELDRLNTNIPTMDLVSVFRTLNSDDYLKKFMYGNITTYLDKNTEGLGAFWAGYYMMRNYNIYSNIMRDILAERPASVMVLYGAGHVEALRGMFAAHPAIELITFESLLKK